MKENRTALFLISRNFEKQALGPLKGRGEEGPHGFQGERRGGSVVTTVILTSAFTRLNLTRSISDFGVSI